MVIEQLVLGAIASVVIRPFVGMLIERLGHRLIMVGSVWIGSACLIALMFEPGLWIITAVVFAWGACAGINQPMALIMVSRTVPSERQGMGMSLRTMANRVVQVTNPVVIGGLSAAIGLTYGFGLIALFLLIFSAFVQKSLKEEPDVKAPEMAEENGGHPHERKSLPVTITPGSAHKLTK